MIFGFNSEVNVGEVVCHVQTECRGASHPVVETLAYCGGQIIYRRASDLLEPAAISDSGNETLRRQAESQHRSVIDALRAGEIAIPPSGNNLHSDISSGIHVRLRNPNSWLNKGTVSLEVEVLRRDNGHPVSEASVKVQLEGAQQETHFTADTDADGLARLMFPLPPMQGEGATLVIRATARSGGDEIRYALRSRRKPAPAEPKT